MDGIHDQGGRPGNAPIDTDSGAAAALDPRWHAAVFASINALFASGVAANTDYFRHAIERIDPDCYLEHGYYGRWLGAAETMLVEAGVISTAEIDARARERGASSADRVAARPGTRPEGLTPGDAGSAQRTLAAAPRYAIGERVRTARDAQPGHTRLPAYARDAVGTVIAWHDGWVFPDSHAHGRGEDPQHLYTIAFERSALWPDSEAGPGDTVCLDLFEPYLCPEPDAP
ncbi:MAG: nitrile hydratase subunit beta [Pseudomonadota bacterium]